MIDSTESKGQIWREDSEAGKGNMGENFSSFFSASSTDSRRKRTFIKVYEKCLQHIHQDYIGEQVFPFLHFLPLLIRLQSMWRSFRERHISRNRRKSRGIERRKLIIGKSIEYWMMMDTVHTLWLLEWVVQLGTDVRGRRIKTTLKETFKVFISIWISPSNCISKGMCWKWRQQRNLI